MTDPERFLLLFSLICAALLLLAFLLSRLKGEPAGVYVCEDCGEQAFGGKGGAMLCEGCIRKEVES